eukprot:2614245-Amphidinium_carterae.2
MKCGNAHGNRRLFLLAWGCIARPAGLMHTRPGAKGYGEGVGQTHQQQCCFAGKASTRSQDGKEMSSASGASGRETSSEVEFRSAATSGITKHRSERRKGRDDKASEK